MFSMANTKTQRLTLVEELQEYIEGRKVYGLSTLAGHTCPGAELCLAKVIIENNKRRIKDGPKQKFRCYSASMEAIRKNVYNKHKENSDIIRKARNASVLRDILDSYMPKNLGICRMHPDGDTQSQKEFDAWIGLANRHPDRLFYGYTKSLHYWVKRLFAIPDNMVLTASYGGKYDHLIERHNLRWSKVIFHPSEAGDLDIDHDDSHAARPDLRDDNFAILLHGIQPAKSEASEAIKVMKEENVEFAYSS